MSSIKEVKMRAKKIGLLGHYQKLVFFALNRFKEKNYTLMREYFARLLINEIEEFMPLWRKKVLDVGGARGEFCRVLNKERKCEAINLDPKPGTPVWPKTEIGFAQNIPFKDNNFDLVICRGVLEHIPTKEQEKSLNEMYRVTKTGGFCYIMIPPWYNPHAGHNLKPFHILPFRLAKALRQIIFRKKINADSYKQAGLYKITFKRALKLIKASGFQVVATRDAHFRLHFLTKVPVVREFAIPSVVFILQR